MHFLAIVQLLNTQNLRPYLICSTLPAKGESAFKRNSPDSDTTYNREAFQNIIFILID